MNIYPNPWDKNKNPYNPWDKKKDWEHGTYPVEKPRVITIHDLFPRLDRWGIGIADTLESLKAISDAKPTYPPYNILKHKDGKWEIEVALAGLVKEDVTITVKDRVLTIAGKTDLESTKGDDTTVIHHGIAQRDFTLTFALAEYVEVEKASMSDGILQVNLVTNLPEEKKPKVIDIK